MLKTNCFACGCTTAERKKYRVLGEYVEHFTCDAECEGHIIERYEIKEADHALRVRQ